MFLSCYFSPQSLCCVSNFSIANRTIFSQSYWNTFCEADFQPHPCSHLNPRILASWSFQPLTMHTGKMLLFFCSSLFFSLFFPSPFSTPSLFSSHVKYNENGRIIISYLDSSTETVCRELFSISSVFSSQYSVALALLLFWVTQLRYWTPTIASVGLLIIIY